MSRVARREKTSRKDQAPVHWKHNLARGISCGYWRAFLSPTEYRYQCSIVVCSFAVPCSSHTISTGNRRYLEILRAMVNEQTAGAGILHSDGTTLGIRTGLVRALCTYDSTNRVFPSVHLRNTPHPTYSGYCCTFFIFSC